MGLSGQEGNPIKNVVWSGPVNDRICASALDDRMTKLLPCVPFDQVVFCVRTLIDAQYAVFILPKVSCEDTRYSLSQADYKL